VLTLVRRCLISCQLENVGGIGLGQLVAAGIRLAQYSAGCDRATKDAVPKEHVQRIEKKKRDPGCAPRRQFDAGRSRGHGEAMSGEPSVRPLLPLK
jgi:hypothetical protein